MRVPIAVAPRGVLARRRLAQAVRGSVAVPAVAGVVIAALARLPYFHDVLELDASTYLTIGSQWLHGVLPYRDLFDNKGPLMPELYLVLSLTRSVVLVRLALMVTFAVSMVSLGSLVERHGSRRAAWLVVVIYALAGSSPLFEGQDPNTEQFALPLMIAAVDFADRFASSGRWPSAVLCGVVTAAAVALKAVYLIAALPAAVLLIQAPRRRSAGVALALLGGAVGLGAIVAPYIAQGTVHDMLWSVFTYNRHYVSEGWHELVQGGGRAMQAFWLSFPGVGLLLTASALGVVAVREPRHRRLAWLGLGWALAGLVIARSGLRVFPHYFIPMLPGLALMAGLGLDALAGELARGRAAALCAVVVLGLAGELSLGPGRDAIANNPSERFGTDTDPAAADIQAIGARVRRLTSARQRIWVATEGDTNTGQGIYWLADRRPAARFLYPFDTVPPTDRQVGASLARRPPAVIVVLNNAPEDYLQGAIRKGHLHQVATVQQPEGDQAQILAGPSAR